MAASKVAQLLFIANCETDEHQRNNAAKTLEEMHKQPGFCTTVLKVCSSSLSVLCSSFFLLIFIFLFDFNKRK